MPIYVYKCSACGHEQDVLQKMSDPRLTVCPECGQSTYTKQVTSAGFQLKGSGWYVTDFRDKGAKPSESKAGHNHAPAAGEPAAGKPADASSAAAAAPAAGASGDAASSAPKRDKPAGATAAPANTGSSSSSSAT